jgi:hypothetical protein
MNRKPGRLVEDEKIGVAQEYPGGDVERGHRAS